ncbi:hypothetical protein JCM10296v2_002681 [Rhodotorula toruloides]
MNPFDRLPDELVSHILDSHRSPLSGYWDRAFFACFTVCRRWERLARALLYRGVIRVESEESSTRLEDLSDEEAKQIKRLVFAGEWDGDVGANLVAHEKLEAAAGKLKQLESMEVRLASNAVAVLARFYLGSDMLYDFALTSRTFASLVVLVVNSSTAIEVSSFTSARLPSLKAAYFSEHYSIRPSFDYLGFDQSRIGSCTYLQLEITASTLIDRDVAYARRPDRLAESEAAAHLVDQTYPAVFHMRGSMLATGRPARSLEEIRQKMAQFPNLVTYSVPTYLAAYPKACVTHIASLCKQRGVTLLRNSVGDRSDLDYEILGMGEGGEGEGKGSGGSLEVVAYA